MDVTDLELKIGESNTERFEMLRSKTLGFKYNKIEKEELKTTQNKYTSDVVFLTRILHSEDFCNSIEAEMEGLNIVYSLEYNWFKIASAFERVLLEDGMPTKVNKLYTFDDNLPWTDEIKRKFESVECVLEKVVTKEYLQGTRLIHKTAAMGLTRLTHAKSYFKVDKSRQGLGLMLEAMQYYGMLITQLNDLEIQMGRAQLGYGQKNNGGKRPSLLPIAPLVQKVIDNYLIKKPKASNTEVFKHITKRLNEDNKLIENENTNFYELRDAISDLKQKLSENNKKADLALKISTLRQWKTRGYIKL